MKSTNPSTLNVKLMAPGSGVQTIGWDQYGQKVKKYKILKTFVSSPISIWEKLNSFIMASMIHSAKHDIVQNMIYLIETWDIYLLCPTNVNEPRVSETLVVIA